MIMKAVRLLSLLVIVVPTLFGCVTPDTSHDPEFGRIKKGMTPKEVEAIVGHPEKSGKPWSDQTRWWWGYYRHGKPNPSRAVPYTLQGAMAHPGVPPGIDPYSDYCYEVYFKRGVVSKVTALRGRITVRYEPRGRTW